MQKSNPPKKIFKKQSQSQPGLEFKMDPLPEFDYGTPGSEKLLNKNCIITGGDSGIGRAVAIAFAREGANVAIVYKKKEAQDAEITAQYIKTKFNRKCITVAANLAKEEQCMEAAVKIIKKMERIDVLVNNAAIHYPAKDLSEITTPNLLETFAVNIFAMFWLTKAVLPYMKKGANIINTTSVTAYRGSSHLIDYSATKGAIVSFTRSLASNLVEKGIRVNGVAPGPVWTPLIPASMPDEKVQTFGTDSPMKRPAQPAELAPAYVFLASDEAAYISGEIIHVNGGEIVNS
ncbi:MAG: family oxidoreductase [Crocinitomicaceae bacterium]|jgi:NAD(P)-dependent dehydrogenase (short-subunit alcohol dehydrogenase family)|nr:family oxidoreductase [Crocinitomicaceae bacterium]